MRVMRYVLTIVLLAFSAAPALALPAAEDSKTVVAPQWRIGSSWEYSDGYGLRVASSANGATVFERMDAPGQWFSMRGFLRQDAVSAGAKRQTIYRSVPPSAGDALNASEPLTFQREYLSNGQTIVHVTSWSVEGHQTVTVPAGTFDCWVIVWRARSLKGNWTGFERWWYSPEAQHYVRMEYKYGTTATASRVLMRYHLGEAALPIGPAATTPSSAAIVEPLQPSAPSALAPVDMIEPEPNAATPAGARISTPIPGLARFLARITGNAADQ